MSFIGNTPAESYSTVVKDTFSGNDSTTDFTLSIPATTNSVEVLVENVQQEPTTAYTISGTTLSFTAAPVTGTNNIYVIHRGPAVQQVTPPAGVAIDASTVTASGDISTDGNVNTDTINEKTSATGVTIDGVLLKDGTVTVNGGTDNIVSRFKSTDAVSVIGFEDSTTTADNVYVGAVGNDLYGYGSGSVYLQSGGSDSLILDASSNLKFNSGYGSVATAYGCRAWANINGSSSPASIRGSGGVSSVTDNGTGEYVINLSFTMPDVNYFAVASDGVESGNWGALRNVLVGADPNSPYFVNTTTTSFQVLAFTTFGSYVDINRLSVAVFR